MRARAALAVLGCIIAISTDHKLGYGAEMVHQLKGSPPIFSKGVDIIDPSPDTRFFSFPPEWVIVERDVLEEPPYRIRKNRRKHCAMLSYSVGGDRKQTSWRSIENAIYHSHFHAVSGGPPEVLDGDVDGPHSGGRGAFEQSSSYMNIGSQLPLSVFLTPPAQDV